MPSFPVSNNVHTFMQSADFAAMRTAMGLGSTDTPVFAALILGSAYLVGGSNQLWMRNGSNAQSFIVANTHTNASNFERGFFGFVGNVLRIAPEALGTGVARDFEIQTNGITRLTINAGAGIATFSGTVNCGALTSTSNVTVGQLNGLYWNGRGRMQSPADGIIRISNNAATSFTRLELGVLNQGIHQGAGSPEGVVTGLVGSIFLRTNGGAASTIYVKESGTGNTGWVAK